MASFNKVVLMGNLTRAPELKDMPGGTTKVGRTGIAVNRKYKDKEEVMFIDLVAFGRNAEVMGEYLVKGSPILVEGRLSMNAWEQDGVKRVKHEIIIDSFQMIGNKRDKDSSYSNDQYEEHAPATKPQGKSNPSDMIDEEDIPF